MIYFFLLLILPCRAWAERESFAPLAPLETQFPLGLTEANRQLFIEGPEVIAEEKARNRALWQKTYLPWLVLLSLFCLGGIGGLIYWQRKRLFPPEPSLPWDPRQQAKTALKGIEKKRGDSRAIKNYYGELVRLLYRVLQESWNLSAMERTTTELKQDSLFLSFPPEIKEKIIDFLIEADRVKFSAAHASATNIQSTYEQFLSLIEQLHKPKQTEQLNPLPSFHKKSFAP